MKSYSKIKSIILKSSKNTPTSKRVSSIRSKTKANKNPKNRSQHSPFKKINIKDIDPIKRAENSSSKKLLDFVKKNCKKENPGEMVYSSVMYQYKNDTAKKVNKQIFHLKKSLLFEAKNQAKKKRGLASSISKSLRKKTKRNTNMKRSVILNDRVSVKLVKPRTPEKLLKFETFRKKTDPENSSNNRSSTAYETIRKETPSKYHAAMSSFSKKGGVKNKRNYSLTQELKKENLRTLKRGFQRASSNHNGNFSVLKTKLKKNNLLLVNMKKNYCKAPSFFVKKKKKINSKKKSFIVQKEYNLPKYKKLMVPSVGLNFFHSNNKNSKGTHFASHSYKWTKSNETLKMEVPQRSTTKLDSLTETMRNKSDLSPLDSLPGSSDINKQLLEELRQSQLQNLKFTEIINELQKQIKNLKKDQIRNFSFKNLSAANTERNPTVESGNNSK